MVDKLRQSFTRRNIAVGLFTGLVLGAVLGVAFVPLPDDEPDKVTAEDVIVTPQKDDQGEQTGTVKINNTADKKIPVNALGEERKIDANSSIQYSSEAIPLLVIYNQEGDALYQITNEPAYDEVTVERNPDLSAET